MATAETTITRYRGDTYPLVVTLKENGVAVDLSGATVNMSLALPIAVVITATITDAANGEAQFEFTQAHIGEVGRFVYDINVDDGTYITTYVKGILELTSDVVV